MLINWPVGSSWPSPSLTASIAREDVAGVKCVSRHVCRWPCKFPARFFLRNFRLVYFLPPPPFVLGVLKLGGSPSQNFEFSTLEEKNYSKQTKYINLQYSPILHGCMNTCRGKAKFETFGIILKSVCSSGFINVRITTKLKTEEYVLMQFKTQAGNIITNKKVKYINITWI